MATRQIRITGGELLAKETAHRLLRLAPKGATHALVGPPLVYDDDDTLGIIVVLGTPRAEHKRLLLDLGRLVDDPMDHPLAALMGAVMLVTESGELTMREGREARAAIVGGLTGAGLRVEDCADERDLTDAYCREYPGDVARKLRAAFDAERMA